MTHDQIIKRARKILDARMRSTPAYCGGGIYRGKCGTTGLAGICLDGAESPC
jgi:hypothetical protein